MRGRSIVGGILAIILAGVLYENVYLAGRRPSTTVGETPRAEVQMVSPDKAKVRMIYFWGDCKCGENTAAESISQQYAGEVHSRIVRLQDPDRKELMRRYKVDKGPYTVFINPKTRKVLMAQRWATYDDFVESIHEMLTESGYRFADTGQPVARGVARVGKPAPEINVISEASIGIALHQYQGRKVLLAFLCGCDRCKAVIPKLNAIVRSTDQDQLTFLGIGAFSKEGRDKFKADMKPEFPLCIDPDRKTIIHYASEACPRFWLIDEQGIIRYTNKDVTAPAAKLAAELHRQLGA